jgi:hypothetical protein
VLTREARRPHEKHLSMARSASKLTGMKVRLDEVAKDALALPVDDQEVLAERLIGNLVSRMPAELKKRQLSEVMRRRAAHLERER